MKLFAVVGEPSGDLHAADVFSAFKDQLGSAFQSQFFGGDKMIAQMGAENCICHCKELSFMGVLDVVKNLGTISRKLKLCKQAILDYKPDALLLVDYPGFNLKIAQFAHQHQIPVYYYIAPKVWVWKKNRIKQIKAFVDQLLVIFPFEKTFFETYHIPTTYVGNPLTEQLATIKPIPWAQRENILALIPGSRKQEVIKNLPKMLQIARRFPQMSCVVTAVSHLPVELYRDVAKDIEIVFDDLPKVVSRAKVAMTCSGTATLETALLDTPQVVTYDTNWLTYKLGKLLIKGVNYISLVNILADKEVIKEHIQSDFNTENTANEISNILDNTMYREQMLEEYKTIQSQLNKMGTAQHVATQILSTLNS